MATELPLLGGRRAASGRPRDDGDRGGTLLILAGVLALVPALVAGFGWMYALRGAGLFGFGPHVSDSLPLLQLAGESAQPLARVIVAWLPVGAIAGAGLMRLPRSARAPLALAVALVLLGFASQASFAVAHTLNLGHVLSTRAPGWGVLAEALLFTAGTLLAPTRRS